LKLVALSDTHGFHENYGIPEGDIFVFGGDFCNYGNMKETLDFSLWLKKLPHQYKIICLGNHDVFCEKAFEVAKSFFQGEKIYYLVDEEVVIKGIKFYASPWVRVCGSWGWQKESPDLKMIWDKIPEDTEVLITHSAPYKILDKTSCKEHIGCNFLRERVRVLKPKYHLFGHVHESGGQFFSDRNTKYFNLASRVSCAEIEI
jgi:Icc-related predicted phosphoesterase